MAAGSYRPCAVEEGQPKTPGRTDGRLDVQEAILDVQKASRRTEQTHRRTKGYLDVQDVQGVP